MAASRPFISTHVLDTSAGRPATGVEVSLSQCIDGVWTHVSTSATNSDGRCADLLEQKAVGTGLYKLRFNTAKYFSEINCPTIYPLIEITFECASENQHYHIPLLLNPFGYTTYRGS